ncbi:MAG: hypothetical protein EZS28_027792 [Streblomastix strix]|uniref:Uncharacterized protein n=1 Tax=Streblomastix strix TaxID=222440 RepID=A0A5J4V2Q9_9EUKA|nr:MAG: hypothetical protein EZS28_027792 [Streblomastix strix]
MSAVDGGRAFRRAIVVAELMNIALDYSRYQMFEVLIVDQGGGTEIDGVYEEATGVANQLVIELNQEYDQLYQLGYYNKVCLGKCKDAMFEKLQQMQQGQDAQQDSQHLGMDADMHQGMIHRGMMDDGTYGYSTAQYQMVGQPGFDRQTQGFKFDMTIKN